jgi:excisionase family DNA binding protein
MSKEIMTVDEVAEYLDLAPATIYQKVHDKSIPYTKIRNLLRFPKNIIDAWLAKNTTHPQPDMFEEFARWHSRHLFKEWLKSKGHTPEEISNNQLEDLARDSLHDLLDKDA